MKKLVLLAAIASVGFVSCKKDYTCTCTVSDSSSSGAAITASTTIKATKKDAKASCEAGNSTVGTVTSKCEIK